MNNKIQTFKDLYAWKEGHGLVLMIYRYTKNFPDDERFGLTSQIRRAIVSFTSNIAEGFSRRTDNDKTYYYTMALGSLTEAQSQMEIAKDLGYISIYEYRFLLEQAVKVHKITNGLIKKTRSAKHDS